MLLAKGMPRGGRIQLPCVVRLTLPPLGPRRRLCLLSDQRLPDVIPFLFSRTLHRRTGERVLQRALFPLFLLIHLNYEFYLAAFLPCLSWRNLPAPFFMPVKPDQCIHGILLSVSSSMCTNDPSVPLSRSSLDTSVSFAQRETV